MGMRGLRPNSTLATKPRYRIIIRLIELRKKAKLTVPQLARLAGFHPSNFAKWERFTGSPSFKNIERRASALGYEITLKRRRRRRKR
jgi:transcriptional regulator with XRE-family HTH domain